MGNIYEFYDAIASGTAPAFNADAAYDFLDKHPDPVIQARASHWSGDIDDDFFWECLEQYRGANGGFKGGLDPDYKGDVGSIHTTIEVLRMLVAHQLFEGPQLDKTFEFLRANELPDGSWQEIPDVCNSPQCPEWYKPAQFRICETALIAGYAQQLGAFDLWSSGAKYVRQAWINMPISDNPTPYWAVLLLLGRSTTSADKSIVLDAVDNLSAFVRKHEIDPFDCSYIMEVLNDIDLPESVTLLKQLIAMLGAAQDPEDGGIRTAYGSALRPAATFNALIATALMMQRGLIAEE